MPASFDAFLRRQGFVLLDGGLATELERAGHDLNDPLWSAKVLLEDPGAVEAAHTAYLRAGADCVTTATYQATYEGLAARGVASTQAEGIFRDAVDLAVRARDHFWTDEANRKWPAQRPSTASAPQPAGRTRPLVAASIGPYGAFLADGSEYHGNYGVGPATLADFHRRRLRLLADSPADILACETIPSFTEARVLAALVEDATEKPAWFTFTCRDAAGGRTSECRLSDGTPIDDVASWAEESASVYAVGVNCTKARLVPGMVRALVAGTRKPVVAYPNGGGEWDAAMKRWGQADDEPDWAEACRDWIAEGAAAVGGCCRVGPADIRAMRAALDRHVRVPHIAASASPASSNPPGGSP